MRKTILHALAQATLDLAETLPEKDLPELADAVLRLLAQERLSRKGALFLHLLRRACANGNRPLPVSLVTHSGHAGTHGESLAAFLHLSLGKPVTMEESAEPNLIGGALLSYHNERFDASLRGTLSALERHLLVPSSAL